MEPLYKSHNYYKKLKLTKTIKLSKLVFFYNETNQKLKKKLFANTKLLNNYIRYKTSIYKNYINLLKMQSMLSLLSNNKEEIILNQNITTHNLLGLCLNRKLYINHFIKNLPSLNYEKNKLLIYKFFSLKLKSNFEIM